LAFPASLTPNSRYRFCENALPRPETGLNLYNYCMYQGCTATF
jgi:hypothetical protein